MVGMDSLRLHYNRNNIYFKILASSQTPRLHYICANEESWLIFIVLSLLLMSVTTTASKKRMLLLTHNTAKNA